MAPSRCIFRTAISIWRRSFSAWRNSLRLGARRIFIVDTKHNGWAADWVILSHNKQMLDGLHQAEGTNPRKPPNPPFPLWTDQRHDLLEVLR